MRERDEAAFQPGSALFLRRVRGAHGPPELFQIGRRAVALRDPGGLRVEQDVHVRSERAGAERATELRRFDSGGVGARYCRGARPRAEARSRWARHVRRQNEEGDALQTPRPAGTAMRPASRDGVSARNKEGGQGSAVKTLNGVLDGYGCVP